VRERKWKYWRISKSAVESRETAVRAAPRGFKYHTSTLGEHVFRRPLIPNGERP